MYKHVNEREAQRYRSDYSNIMEQLRDLLYEKYDINTLFSLVGSGGDSRKMVTRKGPLPDWRDRKTRIVKLLSVFFLKTL